MAATLYYASVLLRILGCLLILRLCLTLRQTALWFIAAIIWLAAIYQVMELNVQAPHGADEDIFFHLLRLFISLLIVIGIVVLGAQIQRGSEAEDLLVQKNEEYVKLIEQASDGIFTLDRDGQFLEVNDGLATITGRSEAELLETSLTDLVLVSEIPMLVMNLEELLMGDRFLLELHLLHKREHPVPVEVSAKMLSDGRIIGIARDMSERRKREAALEEAENKFLVLAEHVPGVIYLCKNDARYTMLYINDAVEALTGYPKSKFLSDEISFVELFHDEDYQTVFDEVESSVRKRESFTLQYRLRHRDGSYRWVHEVGTGVYRNDELRYLEGFLMDITSLKKSGPLSTGAPAGGEPTRTPATMLSSAVDGLCVLNEGGVITYANEALLRKLGYSIEDFCGNRIADFSSSLPENLEGDVSLRAKNGEQIAARMRRTSIQTDRGSDGSLLLISL